MTPAEVAKAAVGLGELGVEALFDALLPNLPIVQLINLANKVASFIEAKSRPEQIKDAEDAIIAANDLAEAEATRK